ncbi:phosphatase PAP2 family protein [Pseudidiomarina donghaiensis]|uniref:phosphatase PAP2 family protein n=1 Tax=Pseudidiomarina donghaiensis TaxID=519452 RepID=UPI003A969E6C
MTAFMTRWVGRLSQFDQRSFHWLNGRARRWCGHKVTRWVSRSGDGYSYAIIACLLASLHGTESVPLITTLVVAFAVEIPLFTLLKRLLKRQRPYQRFPSFHAVIMAHDQFSFPSGHTTAAFLFAGIMSAYFPAWNSLFYVWAIAVGLSRVLLGVHYPGDIAAGALLGSALAWLALGVV